MLVPGFGIRAVHLECLQEACEPFSPLSPALPPSAWPLGPFSRPSREGRAAEVPCWGFYKGHQRSSETRQRKNREE